MKKSKLITIIILLGLFIINTILVLTNNAQNIDNSIHNFIIQDTSEVLTRAMKMITFLGSTKFIITITVFILVLFIILKKKKIGIITAIMLIASTILNNVVKLIIQRPRPEYMMVSEKSFSYPSGHTMASVIVYGFLIYLLLKSNFKKSDKILFSLILILVIIGVAISRIYLGAHFFTDVFGGLLLSIMLIILFDLINDKKKWID